MEIETLSVKEMLQNHHLAQAIADQGFGRSFTRPEYKAERYGTQLVAADRWFPSSKLCSTPGCGYLNKDLTLKDREWTCPSCGVTHDHDVNAAINLQGLATRPALPVATRLATDATGFGDPAVHREPNFDGKATPVRHDASPAGTMLAASGQEEIGVRNRAPRFYSSAAFFTVLPNLSRRSSGNASARTFPWPSTEVNGQPSQPKRESCVNCRAGVGCINGASPAVQDHPAVGIPVS